MARSDFQKERLDTRSPSDAINTESQKQDTGKAHGHGGGGMMSLGIPQFTREDFTKVFSLAMSGEFTAAFAFMLNHAFDPAGTSLVRTMSEGICSDCTILSSRADLVFEDGKRADIAGGVYLHHLNVLNLGIKDVYNWIDMCPSVSEYFSFLKPPVSGPMPFQPLAVAGVDESTQFFTSLDGNFKSGYYVAPTDSFLLQFEAINYNKEAKDVYIQIEEEHVPGRIGKQATFSPVSALGRHNFTAVWPNLTILQDVLLALDSTAMARPAISPAQNSRYSSTARLLPPKDVSGPFPGFRLLLSNVRYA
jgi:hypothetical protein